MRVRHISLRGMAHHIAANEVLRAQKLVASTGVMTTEVYLGKLEDALRRERIALTDDAFRREYAGLLVFTR